MVDVVEVKTRDCEHLEVIDAGRFLFDLAAECGVLTLERPGYETR
jgi:hypothetical protein